MSMVNLSEPLRTALISSGAITSLLVPYKNSYPIFTRRPVPDDAPDIGIIISSDIITDEQDGINDFRPIITRDIIIYGPNDIPADKYRRVEQLSFEVRNLFHNKSDVITVPGWTVVLITVNGPLPIYREDQSVLTAVTLAIRLAKK